MPLNNFDEIDEKPNVEFYVHSLIQNYKHISFSNGFYDVKVLIYTTPGEIYTAYEKLLLPFDTETWILLAITFLITFLIIILLNRLSKKAQDLIYGKQIDTPFWNVTSIFFGISQTKLPAENFSRYILTFFIVFCLIFRTCFQSKFFEFMTSNPARKPPRTVQDLIDMNYTLLLSEGEMMKRMVAEENNYW